MPEQAYQRLGRGPRGSTVGVAVSGRSSLWLGPDHLLSVDSSGFTEEYKRFYYRDIQALTLRRTSRRGIIGLLLMLPLCLFSIMAVFGSDMGPFQVFFGFLAVVLGVMLIYNFAAGPTTACYLRTAVQTEELPALNRLRRARKALARLRPLIASAQGEFAPGEVSSRVADFLAERPPPSPPPLASGTAPAPAPWPPEISP